MLVVEDWSSTYPDAVNQYWNLTDFSEDDGKNVVFFGWATAYDRAAYYREKYQHYENKMFFNSEHPCAFYSGDQMQVMLSANADRYFDKVFTQCPFTAAWLNEIQQTNCFKSMYPASTFNIEDVVFQKQEKIHDVMYWGGIHSPTHVEIINTIKDYDYNFLSLGFPEWNLRDPSLIDLVTHTNLPRRKMWELLSKTRVNVMTNVLFLNESHVNNIKRIEGWEKNKAFSHLESGILPQIKTRPFESAFHKTLMLVKKDPWNLQEDFFEPDKEFLYYENKSELKDMLDDIKINWHNYEPIVENAFEKACNSFTTKHFIDQFKRECV